MEPSRIERALRNGPVDEPAYRAEPLILDVPSGRRGSFRGVAGSVAAVVATAVIVVLASVMAFVVLSPGLAPADRPETDEWGPLAVTTAATGGDEALATGAIRISDECVVLETVDDRSTLLVWSSDQASWDPQGRQIQFVNRDGSVVELNDGQQVGVGGSGRGLSAEVLSPGEWDGLSWEDWLPTIDWASAPAPTCRADSVWFVGEVIVDLMASPADSRSRSRPRAPPA